MQSTLGSDAWENKFSALPYFSKEEQIKQGRELYQRYLDEYPTAVNRWCEYIDLEMKYENFLGKLFKDTSNTYLNDIMMKVKITLIIIRKPISKKIQEEAFILAIKVVGLDINATPIYTKFKDFLYENEHNNRVAIRELFYDINRTPMCDRLEMVNTYELMLEDKEKKEEHAIFETTKASHLRFNSYNIKTEKLKKQHQIEYCTKSKSLGAKEVLSSYIDILEYETTLDGQPKIAERLYSSNGKKQRYDVCPKSLELKAQQERIYYVMNKMLLTFYRYPQAWIICAQYFQRKGNIDLALTLLKRGQHAVECPALKIYEAFCLMLKGQTQEGINLLGNSELENVCKIKMAGRGFGLQGFRSVLKKLLSDLGPRGFIAAAETEYFMFGRRDAAKKLYKEALNRYGKDRNVVTSYYKFINGTTPPMIIKNLKRNWQDPLLDSYMNELVEKTFASPKPEIPQEVLDAGKLYKEHGAVEEQRITGDDRTTQTIWAVRHYEVNKDLIREFINVLPPSSAYGGKRVDVTKLLDVLSSIIS
ncbi:Cleavage stimulation factor 77 kDa subunit [Entamoeba marina]